MSKQIPARKRLAAIFVSFTILVVGSISLLGNMSIDYYSVLGTMQKLLPASIIIGSLGWVMGMILDKPKKKHKKRYNDLYLNAFSKENFSGIEKQADTNIE